MSGEIDVAGSMTPKVIYRRVDRATVEDRAWLEHLDDRLYDTVERVARIERETRAEFEQRLAQQGADLREHTIAVTRQGWQYIFAGLLCSALGTLLLLVA